MAQCAKLKSQSMFSPCGHILILSYSDSPSINFFILQQSATNSQLIPPPPAHRPPPHPYPHSADLPPFPIWSPNVAIAARRWSRGHKSHPRCTKLVTKWPKITKCGPILLQPGRSQAYSWTILGPCWTYLGASWIDFGIIPTKIHIEHHQTAS